MRSVDELAELFGLFGRCARSDLLRRECWHCRGLEGSEAEQFADQAGRA